VELAPPKKGCYRIALSGGTGFALLNCMTLEEIGQQIKSSAEQMNARYGGIVFDEWAVVSLVENKARVLAYTGPRNDDFLKHFARDLGSLRVGLLGGQYGPGDFEFSRHGTGTVFESFMVLGQGIYLICNNTSETMDVIAKNPRWLDAQVPFVELAEKVRANPLAVSWDTRIFTKS
jgi:hypothetical protein